MIQILYVAIGGAIGSIARYLTTQLVNELHSSSMPWGTFSVNFVGALLIGICFVLIDEKQLLAANLRYLLIIGVLGGFTTFSAFSLESFRLIESGQIMVASSYIIASTVCCLLGVWLGALATRYFF